MATSDIDLTEGSGVKAATHTISEDAVTKHIQRVNLNHNTGVEVSKLEDSAHSSGDAGIPVWAVRRDTAASGASDGDYVTFNTDDLGNLRVHIDDRQLDGNEYETVAAGLSAPTPKGRIQAIYRPRIPPSSRCSDALSR